jgi:integrase/recombinase XerD
MSVQSPKNGRTAIRAHVAGYLRDLAARGYAGSTQKRYRVDLLRVIAYAEQTGVCSMSRFTARACDLLPNVSGSRWTRRGLRSTVNRFAEYLMRQGVVRDRKTDTPKSRYDRLICEFVRFQVEHRGICPEYAKAVRGCCRCFFDYLEQHHIRRLVALRPEAVLSFIAEDGKRYIRRTASSRCSILRTFLTYLHRRGTIRRDLAGIVVGPRMYKGEACPRFISRVQTQAILSQVDRSTPIGLRDYTMILLLITYGLRGGEVIRLSLDDINWREKLLLIKARKAGNNTVYPLAPSVAHALIRYLRRVRPRSADRHVFLSVKVPHRPLVYTWGLGNRVRQYMRRAGVDVPRPGTHTFRYSCAQLLLATGTPLKVISDYIGHSHPETTQQYLKIAVDDLRNVALTGAEVVL